MIMTINDNELGQKEDIILDVFCLHCDEKTSQEIVAHEYVTTEREKITFNHIDYYSQIIVCRNKGCENSSLRTVRIEKGKSEIIESEFYPGRKDKGYIRKYLPSGKVFEKYPRISALYKESIDAYSNEMNFSAGAAIRSLLEEICKSRGHKEKVMSDIIDKMLYRKKNPRFQELNENERKTALKILLDSYDSNFDILMSLNNIVQKSNSERIDPNEVELSEKEKETVEIKANLSKQIDYLKEELKAKRPNSTIDLSILSQVVKWGNGTIHGSITPTTRNAKSAIGVVEFIFHALYIDEAAEASFSEHSSEFSKEEDEG